MATEGLNFKVQAFDQTQSAFRSVLARTHSFQKSATAALTAPFRALGSMNLFAFTQNVGSLWRVAKGFIDLNTEAQTSERKLGAVLKATGFAAGLTSREILGISSSLQNVTTFGDEAITDLQMLLSTFKNIRGEEFKRATEAALDLATVLGQDAAGSARLLGRALSDPEKGLTMLQRATGIFSASQKAMIAGFMRVNDLGGAQRVILDKLAGSIGGAARAVAQTGGGALAQFQNALGDLGEKLGQLLDPFLVRSANKLQQWSQFAESFLKTNMVALQGIIDTSLGSAAGGFAVGLKTAFGGAAGELAKSLRTGGIVGALAELPPQITKIFLEIEQSFFDLVSVIETSLVSMQKPIATMVAALAVLTRANVGKSLEGWAIASDAMAKSAEVNAKKAEELTSKIKEQDAAIRSIRDKAKDFDKIGKLDAIKQQWSDVGEKMKAIWGNVIPQAFAVTSKASGKAADEVKEKFDKAAKSLEDAQRKLAEVGMGREQREFEVALSRARNVFEERRMKFGRAETLVGRIGGEKDEQLRQGMIQEATGLVTGMRTDKGVGDPRSRRMVDVLQARLDKLATGFAQKDVGAAQQEMGAARMEQTKLKMAPLMEGAQLAKQAFVNVTEAAGETARALRGLPMLIVKSLGVGGAAGNAAANAEGRRLEALVN